MLSGAVLLLHLGQFPLWLLPARTAQIHEQLPGLSATRAWVYFDNRVRLAGRIRCVRGRQVRRVAFSRNAGFRRQFFRRGHWRCRCFLRSDRRRYAGSFRLRVDRKGAFVYLHRSCR